MSMRYGRIHAQAGENPEVGTMLEDCPLAASLFFLSFTRSDLYGILPADPRRYRSIVAPIAMLRPEAVAEAIKFQEDLGLVRRYTTSDGEELLQIVNYHKWQEVRWSNGVGPPEHELPEWWEPPQEFIDWITSDKCLRWQKRSERWWSVRERYCSAEVVQQLRSRCATLNKTQDTVHKNDSNDSPASDDAGGEKQKSPRKPRAPKPASEDTQAQAAIRACYEAVFGEGAVPTGRGYSSLIALYQEHGEDVFRKLADHIRGRQQPEGTDPWAWFKKMVREELSAKFKWLQASGPDRRKGAFIRLRDGSSFEYEADWSFGQHYEVNAQRSAGNWNEATGCTKTPVNGFCCDDGFFYPTGQEPERWAA